jgi:hypothetical protein
MDGLTYQQVLADHYEETGKNVLVFQNEYTEEVPPEDKHPDELESQEDFQKFLPRHSVENHEPPAKQDDKTKLSLVYDKHTQVRLINIDSRFRNYGATTIPNKIPPTGDQVTDYFSSITNEQIIKARALYTQSSPTNYIFKLKEPIKNVISVRLSSIEIPNSFYTFSRARGNVLFQIQLPSKTYGTPGNKIYTLEIPAGNWDASVSPSIDKTLTGGLGSPIKGFPYVIDSTGASVATTLQSYPSVLWKLQYTLNSFFSNLSNVPNSSFQIGGNNYFEVGYNDLFVGKINIRYNSSGTPVPFDIFWEVDPNAVADNAADLASNYPQNPTNPINRIGSVAADFGLGYNLGFRQTSYMSNTVINAEANLNTIDTNYVFLTLDPDWKVIEQETPDRTQLYSFAKIVITSPKFSINYDSGNNTLTKEYYLKQPTNIHSIPVRLSDPYDQDIDLNGLDFSFTLECREVLHSGLYETMRS